MGNVGIGTVKQPVSEDELMKQMLYWLAFSDDTNVALWIVVSYIFTVNLFCSYFCANLKGNGHFGIRI